MSTVTRNLSNISGANVTNPTANNFTANGLNSYANDAAFETVITPVAGSIYWNSTDKALREYNGASWQYDKTIFSVQTDAATTGASQSITPNAFDQVIRFTIANTLTSIQNIVPTIQKMVYLVNDQSSQRLTITNNAGGTAANRIITGSGSDLVVETGQIIGLLYDEDATRWRVISGVRPASALESFASDAAFITAHPGTLTAGSAYFNTASSLFRQYNGTAWQNDKTSYTTQADAATTGSSQDVTPGIDQIIRFTQGSLVSIRGIAPAVQQVLTLINGQASQVITLLNEDAGATAANRIVTGTNSDFSIAVGQAVQLVYDSSGTRWRVAGAASNASSSGGEVNALSNPNAASNLTGWTGATRVTTGSPLDPIVTTAFSIANAAVAESPTSGGYASISSLPTALRSMKNKISFYFTTPATDVYKVSVYQGATRLSLSSDTSGATTLPASITGGFFYATFDTTTAAAYSVNVTRTSGSTGACLITTVIFGPGILAQGYAGGPWQSWIPTFAGLGTPTSVQLFRRLVGDTYFVRGTLVTGTTTAVATSIILTAGSTINSQALGTVNARLGQADRMSAGNQYSAGLNPIIFWDGSTTDRVFLSIAATTTFTKGNGSTIFGAAETVSIDFSYPAVELAGSNVVNLGAGAQQEFTYNSDVSATSSVTASGFTNGAGGVALSTNWAAGTAYIRRVRFQTPIQNSDIIVVEVQSIGFGNNEWVPIDTAICGYINTSSTYKYGCSWAPVTGSQTDIDVTFNDGGARPSGTFGTATGTAWSVFNTVYNWRVRRANASSPVGFGLAGTDGSSGLVAAGAMPGLVTGVAIASGYVGQVLTATLADQAHVTTNTSQNFNGGSISLTPGVWIAYFKGFCGVAGTTQTMYEVSISSTSATLESTSQVRDQSTGISNARLQGTNRMFNVSANTTIYAVVNAIYTGTAPTHTAALSTFYAIRIA